MENAFQATVIGEFRDHLIKVINSEIGAYLPQLEDPFFLIAATGLGKTLIVPVHLLEKRLRSGTPDPRIWVVEPKIAIAQSLTATLNGLWSDFCRKRGMISPPLFGCKTKVDHTNVDAPIVFVTTGIFGIYGRKNVFRPDRDGVLIDEAHATLEADQAVELAIAVSRRRGVRIDYMSASVDVGDLEDRLGVRIVKALPKRHPVWMHATGQPLEESIEEIVQETLIDFREDGPYAPPPGHPAGAGVAQALSERGRVKGLLVIVPTCASERSEAQRVLRCLKRAPFADQLEFGLLSGATLRDPALRKKYEEDIARWKREKRTYVLVATSVVEMGVTLPGLDVVVTSDQDIECDPESGRISRAPLGVNSLIQRVGRVGRERSGLAVIVKDAGADYASMDDATLNAEGSLKPEPIRFPMRAGRMTLLAWHSYAEGWRDDELKARLTELALPSKIQDDWKRLWEIESERSLLCGIGFIENDHLAPHALELEPWVGRFELWQARDLLNAMRRLDGDARFIAGSPAILRYMALNKSDQEAYEGFFERAFQDPESLRQHCLYSGLIERYSALSPGATKHRFASLQRRMDLKTDLDHDGLSSAKGGSFLASIHEILEVLIAMSKKSSFPEPAMRLFRAYSARTA